MYNSTVFSSLLKELPRTDFRKAVNRLGTDKHCKGFSSWDHLVAMVFAQISGAKSLREIEAGFNHSPEQHYHLGVGKICRSTLSEANQRRNPELFLGVCQLLAQRLGRKYRREVNEFLYLMDASYIPLSGRGYDEWTAQSSAFRTPGLKLHVMTSSDFSTPVVARVTDTSVGDITEGRNMPIEAGATYVFDKGYMDYAWWHEIHQKDAFFVTRLKKNSKSITVEDRTKASSQECASILSDKVVRLTTKRIGGGKPNPFHEQPIREIWVQRDNDQGPICLATNDFESAAQHISAHYKARWGVELFFKWIKQNLQVKRFVGQSKNAVTIQIFTALIAYLLLQLDHFKVACAATLKQHKDSVRTRLFQRPETEYAMRKRRLKEQLKLQEMQGQLAL